MPDTQRSLVTGFEQRTAVPGAEAIAGRSLCAIIAIAPLPFGSTNLQVIAVWVLALAATAAVASLRPFSWRDVIVVACAALVALCWGLVVAGQLGHGPIFSEQLIDPIWPQTAAVIGGGSIGTASVARHQPFFSAGSQIACLLSLLCGFLVSRNRSTANLLLMTFAVSGLGYAIYGIIAFIFWPDHQLWLPKLNYLNSLVATFFNPNVAAVYFGACALVWLLVLAKRVTDSAAAKQPDTWWHFVDIFFKDRLTAVCFFAFLTVIATMLMTGSRAGSLLSLLAISAALVTSYRRHLTIRGLLLAIPLSLAAVVLFIHFFGGRLSGRFGIQGFFDEGRWNTYISTLNIIQDHSWLGTGLGTFRWAFPKYRSENIPISGIWEQAHSTTLELASEMGIPFTVLICMAWLAILVALARGILTRKRDQIFPVAALWIGLIALIHSQIDFSLQVPGFSIVVCALIGMGLAQSTSSVGRVNLTNY